MTVTSLDKINSCSLLVLSTDSYSDLWDSCTKLHNKYWKDCPWPKYLCSDSEHPPLNGFIPLWGKFNQGSSWSDLTISLLEQITTEYVYVMLDDFFINDVGISSSEYNSSNESSFKI